jgi:hypothetical protein
MYTTIFTLVRIYLVLGLKNGNSFCDLVRKLFLWGNVFPLHIALAIEQMHTSDRGGGVIFPFARGWVKSGDGPISYLAFTCENGWMGSGVRSQDPEP